ncbi:lactate dehydrogenase-like 2-hydroxyacid dehydrogenase [Paenalcaligenes hominis]|uniref:Lactate dehydrogenase-like 2-hydroxyacid dehydrogenase n=1 Tax=Paenalcaligenes hominis TaxID=643674 RepID=A0ABX0WPU8_9BURK|nr:D-glycerate dehydrogenase [Paenalcaligenes hominis]NJB64275.1 lactate dehydrogenase-like 2-hydroxyacid dehydrogenase [Paenalcaligenes hominis]GGE68869.1 D-glycerate dehydrogenase [Paenalcaligenes hominis]
MNADAPQVAITSRIFPESIAKLKAAGFRIAYNDSNLPLEPDKLVCFAHNAKALLVSASTPVNAALIEQLPNLQVIANIGVGYNNIDVAAAAKRGIQVSNTPDVLTETTADLAWALLFTAARRISESERWLREGHWQGLTLDGWLGLDIHSSTLGILGMGRIGSAVARRAQGFGMRVLYHNRTPLAPDQANGATWVDKNTLLSEADHLILVVPYSAQTHHLIGAAELAQMKPSAVLVNIARGGVVDDVALAHALAKGQIAAAGIDVFENEPAIAPELLAAPNAVLTPHIGSATKATRLGMVNVAVANLLDWHAGQRMRNLIHIS